MPSSRLKTVLQARGSEIGEDLVRPITCELIHEPVVAADGNTYERVPIEAWFETASDRQDDLAHDQRAPLAPLVLTPNNTVLRMISKILDECRSI